MGATNQLDVDFQVYRADAPPWWPGYYGPDRYRPVRGGRAVGLLVMISGLGGEAGFIFEGPDALVLFLFSLFHDSKRKDDGRDLGHGKRGAELARTMRDEGAFSLDGGRMQLLELACEGHDAGLTTEIEPIGVCWDADRMDLWRVYKRPKPALFSTEPGRRLCRCPPRGEPPEWEVLLEFFGLVNVPGKALGGRA